jgi:hypothetical protein
MPDAGARGMKMRDYKIRRTQGLGGLMKAGDDVMVMTEVAWVVSAEARPPSGG